MKFAAILFLFTLCFTQAFAQNKAVQGFVVDKDSKLRLAKVYIYNPATDEGYTTIPKVNLLPTPNLVIHYLQH